MNWIKRILLEKWIGRAVVLALAAVGGYLAKNGVDQAIVTNWVDATRPLLEALGPIIVAWALSLVRHSVALNTEPPRK